MIVVTFALPDESRDFVGASGVGPRLVKQRVQVVHTGVGGRRPDHDRLLAALTAGAVEERERPRLLIASGFAGALRPGVRVGDLILGENVSDPALLATARDALAGEPLHVGTLTTTTAAAVETAAAKAALHAETGALAVDMETAWIAADCARAGVPMLSLRVVSDAADQDFPVPSAVMFNAVRQRPRYLALPAYLLTHPARISPFVRFVRGLGPARARLAGALEKVIPGLDAGG